MKVRSASICISPLNQKLSTLHQDSSLSEQKHQSIEIMPRATENKRTTLAAKKRGFCIRKYVSAQQARVLVTSLL